ncbi:hypothetical protein N185_33900 [Sinorhizobium sp. GW3]|nr:hypothetical protein N185_33900 [Sinorhizobium sp. GW3]
MRQLERYAKVAGRKGAARKRRLAADDVGRIEMAKVDEHVALGPDGVEALQGRGCKVERDAGNAGAFIEDATIADRDDVGSLTNIGKRQQLCRELRADAGRIAHSERDDRTRAVSGYTVGRHERCPPLHSFKSRHTLFKILHQVFCILYAAFSVDDIGARLHALMRQR